MSLGAALLLGLTCFGFGMAVYHYYIPHQKD
jgi:hypothetical protein